MIRRRPDGQIAGGRDRAGHVDRGIRQDNSDPEPADNRSQRRSLDLPVTAGIGREIAGRDCRAGLEVDFRVDLFPGQGGLESQQPFQHVAGDICQIARHPRSAADLAVVRGGQDRDVPALELSIRGEDDVDLRNIDVQPRGPNRRIVDGADRDVPGGLDARPLGQQLCAGPDGDRVAVQSDAPGLTGRLARRDRDAVGNRDRLGLHAEVIAVQREISVDHDAVGTVVAMEAAAVERKVRVEGAERGQRAVELLAYMDVLRRPLRVEARTDVQGYQRVADRRGLDSRQNATLLIQRDLARDRPPDVDPVVDGSSRFEDEVVHREQAVYALVRGAVAQRVIVPAAKREAVAAVTAVQGEGRDEVDDRRAVDRIVARSGKDRQRACGAGVVEGDRPERVRADGIVPRGGRREDDLVGPIRRLDDQVLGALHIRVREQRAGVQTRRSRCHVEARGVCLGLQLEEHAIMAGAASDRQGGRQAEVAEGHGVVTRVAPQRQRPCRLGQREGKEAAIVALDLHRRRALLAQPDRVVAVGPRPGSMRRGRRVGDRLDARIAEPGVIPADLPGVMIDRGLDRFDRRDRQRDVKRGPRDVRQHQRVAPRAGHELGRRIFVQRRHESGGHVVQRRARLGHVIAMVGCLAVSRQSKAPLFAFRGRARQADHLRGRGRGVHAGRTTEGNGRGHRKDLHRVRDDQRVPDHAGDEPVRRIGVDVLGQAQGHVVQRHLRSRNHIAVRGRRAARCERYLPLLGISRFAKQCDGRRRRRARDGCGGYHLQAGLEVLPGNVRDNERVSLGAGRVIRRGIGVDLGREAVGDIVPRRARARNGVGVVGGRAGRVRQRNFPVLQIRGITGQIHGRSAHVAVSPVNHVRETAGLDVDRVGTAGPVPTAAAQRPRNAASLEKEGIVVVRRAGQILEAREVDAVDRAGVLRRHRPRIVAHRPDQRIVDGQAAEDGVNAIDPRGSRGPADVDVCRQFAVDETGFDNVHLPQVDDDGALVRRIVQRVRLAGARAAFDPAVDVAVVLEDERIVAQPAADALDASRRAQRVRAVRGGDPAVVVDREGQVGSHGREIQDVFIQSTRVGDDDVAPAIMEHEPIVRFPAGHVLNAGRKDLVDAALAHDREAARARLARKLEGQGFMHGRKI